MNHQEIFEIILHGGNARSLAMEAMMYSRDNKFEEAKKALEEAEREIKDAHEFQTNMIQKEAAGKNVEISLLIIHAQDHLMNALTVIDLAKEIIILNEKIGG